MFDECGLQTRLTGRVRIFRNYLQLPKRGLNLGILSGPYSQVPAQEGLDFKMGFIIEAEVVREAKINPWVVGHDIPRSVRRHRFEFDNRIS